MMAIKQNIDRLGIRRACSAFAVSRATYYRLERSGQASPDRAPSVEGAGIAGSEQTAAGPCAPPAHRPCAVPGRALSEEEVQAVVNVLHSEECVDMTPTEACMTLLDRGEYLCSVRTMYRILSKHGEVKERRAQRRHLVYAKPELLATGPNQVWSWDITRLKGPVKWSYYHLYVIMDLFSRCVVGWMLADRESEDLAKDLIGRAASNQGIPAGQLTIHADRGSSMTSKAVADLLVDLGITKSHSRPQVSNDNPYSESQFRTLKYRPQFPERFGSIEEARSVCKKIITWYNGQHYHSGIGLLTPESVHFGMAQQIIEQRAKHLSAAYAAHPQRFVNKPPSPPQLPSAVYINPPAVLQAADAGLPAKSAEALRNASAPEGG